MAVKDASNQTTDATSEIVVDGRAYEVAKDSAGADPNLLHACLSLGLDLPYFCWHPELGSVGACRQCAVEQYEDEEAEENGEGEIVMACMTPAADGVRIAIEAEEAKEFRASVIEWLMVNHPHDCPVCDEGGECHLQDMTVMTGHSRREFRFPKRTFRNQDLGPHIHHEMNRCIQCYRCVRFYDHAGGDDLQAFASHDHVYFGRHEDGPLESPFSGNLVEVCPTGVFTDKTLKDHYARKWDLQTAPSVCHGCGLGCNTIPGERYDTIRRIRNRYHPDVNGYWLCDRGRYGYEWLHGERRIEGCLRPRGEDEPAEAIEEDDALSDLADAFAPGRRIAAVGSPRASLETNWALHRLATKAGDTYHPGPGDDDARCVRRVAEILERVPSASLRRLRECDAVLLLGIDPREVAPLLELYLREASRTAPSRDAAEIDVPPWNAEAVDEVVQGRTGPFFVATPEPTELDEVATEALRAEADAIAQLGRDVAAALSDEREDSGDDDLPRRIARALSGAERPVVVSGTDAGLDVLDAAAACAERLGSEIFLTVREANSLGAVLPADPDEDPDDDAGDAPTLEDLLERAAGGKIDTLVVAENDLYERAPANLVDRALDAVDHVVALDHTAHATGARASLLLPAAPWAEAAGTIVNNEGRAQRFLRVHRRDTPARESWRWIRDGARAAGRQGWDDLEGLHDVLRELASDHPRFEGVEDLTPGQDALGRQVPRQPHRYSGRTAETAHLDVREPRPETDPDSPLADSMEGAGSSAPTGAGRRTPPPSLAARYRVPGWNSVQALNRFQEEVAGLLRTSRDGAEPSPGLRLLEPDEEDA